MHSGRTRGDDPAYCTARPPGVRAAPACAARPTAAPRRAPARPHAPARAGAVAESWRRGRARASGGLLAALPLQCSGPPGGARRACPPSALAATEAPLPPASWGPPSSVAACAGRARQARGAQVEGMWTDEAVAQVLNYLDGGETAADAAPAACVRRPLGRRACRAPQRATACRGA